MTVTRIRALINPTVDPDKVAYGIEKLFGLEDLAEVDGEIFIELEGIKALGAFRTRIANDKIRTTLSNVFTRWAADSDTLSFGLNRQAAHAGHVSINLQNEDPMGPIQVTISGDIAEVITYLTT